MGISAVITISVTEKEEEAKRVTPCSAHLSDSERHFKIQFFFLKGKENIFFCRLIKDTEATLSKVWQTNFRNVGFFGFFFHICSSSCLRLIQSKRQTWNPWTIFTWGKKREELQLFKTELWRREGTDFFSKIGLRKSAYCHLNIAQ